MLEPQLLHKQGSKLAHLALLKMLLRFRSAKSNSRNFSSPCKTETLLRFCRRRSLVNIARLSLISPDSGNPSNGHLLSTTMPRLGVHEQTMRTYVFWILQDLLCLINDHPIFYK